MLLSETLHENKFTKTLKAGALAAGLALSPIHAQTANIHGYDIDRAANKIYTFLTDQQITPNYQSADEFETDVRAFALISLAAQELQDNDEVKVNGVEISRFKLNMMYSNALAKLRRNYGIDKPNELMGAIQDVVFDQ